MCCVTRERLNNNDIIICNYCILQNREARRATTTTTSGPNNTEYDERLSSGRVGGVYLSERQDDVRSDVIATAAAAVTGEKIKDAVVATAAAAARNCQTKPTARRPPPNRGI